MTITQTVEIPANHRLTIDVPREVPAGRTDVIIQFPVKERMSEAEEIEALNRMAEWHNKEALETLSYQCWNPLENEDR